jgi:hypothetical protein
MGLSEWEKRDAAMWDGFRNGNSSFSPSVADNNNSTTKITTVTEDANGNKQTVVNENKTAADLMKQKQQEAYDREEPGRQAHAKQVAQRAFDSKMLFDPSIKGTPAWMEYGDTTFGPQAQIPAQYTNIDLPNKDVVNAQGLSRGNIFDRINDGIMSGNLDKAEADRIRMEAAADGREEYNAMVSDQTSSLAEDPWTETVDDKGLTDSDYAALRDRYSYGEGRGNGDTFQKQVQDRKDVQALKDSYSPSIVEGGFLKKTPSQEEKKQRDKEVEALKIKQAKENASIFEDVDNFSNEFSKKKDETESAVSKETVTNEVEAKAVIDSPENIAAKAELNKWLESIKDPVVTKEQAQASAEAMINNAVAAAPKNDGSKLKKALILAAGSMLFGSSFTEAVNAGFGVVGKEVEKEQKLAAELAKDQREINKQLSIYAGKQALGDGESSAAALSSFMKSSPDNLNLWKGNTFNGENFVKSMKRLKVPPREWEVYKEIAFSKKNTSGIELSAAQKKTNASTISDIRKNVIKSDDDKKFHKGLTQLAAEFSKGGLVMDSSERGFKNRASFEATMTDWMRDYSDWEKGGRDTWAYHGTDYAADEGYQIISPIPYFWRTVGLMTETGTGDIKPIDASEAKDFGIRQINVIKATLGILYPNDKKSQHAFQVKVRKEWMEEARSKLETEGQGQDGYHYDDYLAAKVQSIEVQ